MRPAGLYFALPFLLMACNSTAPAGDAHPPDAGGEARPGDLPAPISDGAAAERSPDLPAQPRMEAGVLAAITCATPPPPGATLAPPLPTYQGTCPTLVAGMNTITSSGHARKFILVLPANRKPGEKHPVLFMWHWLKSSASSFLSKGDVQLSVDQQRFIALIPESKGDTKLFGVLDLPWPFTIYDSDARMQEEYAFFDDMLACLGQQFSVDKECVATAGVSAGALFTMQLAAARAQHLSSVISLSGGIGGGGGLTNPAIRTWTPPARRLPVFVLWGGPSDRCVLLDFELASQQLEEKLIQQQHFFVECIHNCGHAEPPIEALPGESRYGVIWDFALRHPYWLDGGVSPYQELGLTSKNVPWCGLGKGSAVPRTGTCPPPACPL